MSIEDHWRALRDQMDHSTVVRVPDITEVRVLLAERDALEAEAVALRAAIVKMCDCVKAGEGATVLSYMEMFTVDPGITEAIATVQKVLAD